MQPDRTEALTQLLRQRILILDGAMGTMIQRLKLSEQDFRGAATCGLRDHAHDLRGDNDLLRFTTRTSRPAPISSKPTRSTQPASHRRITGSSTGCAR